MRKVLLVLAAAAIVAAPTAAMAKKHHHRHLVRAPAPVEAANPLDPGWRLFWSGIDVFFFTPVRTVFVVTTPAPIVAKY